jgi:hypothetical protein
MFSSLSTKTLVQNQVAQADPQGKLARREGNGERNEPVEAIWEVRCWILGFEVDQTVCRLSGLWSAVGCLPQKLLNVPGQLFALLCQLRGVGVDFRGVVESLIEFD